MPNWLVGGLFATCVVSGCEKTADNAAPHPKAGSAPGSATTARGSAAVAPPATCDLAGDYRLRFNANGHEGWWLRFRVTFAGADAKAELLAPMPVLGIEKIVPAELVAAQAACKLKVTTTGNIGPMIADVTLDPKTNRVTGTMTRAKPRDYPDEKIPMPLEGVRDVGTPKSPACLVPGIYEIAVSPKANWKAIDRPDKKKDCQKWPPDLSMRVRIEPFGDTIVVDQLAVGKNDPGFEGETVKAEGECTLHVKLQGSMQNVEARLELAGETIKATATTVRVQKIEDGTAGEDQWTCGVDNVELDVKRVKT